GEVLASARVRRAPARPNSLVNGAGQNRTGWGRGVPCWRSTTADWNGDGDGHQRRLSHRPLRRCDPHRQLAFVQAAAGELRLASCGACVRWNLAVGRRYAEWVLLRGYVDRDILPRLGCAYAHYESRHALRAARCLHCDAVRQRWYWRGCSDDPFRAEHLRRFSECAA